MNTPEFRATTLTIAGRVDRPMLQKAHYDGSLLEIRDWAENLGLNLLVRPLTDGEISGLALSLRGLPGKRRAHALATYWVERHDLRPVTAEDLAVLGRQAVA